MKIFIDLDIIFVGVTLNRASDLQHTVITLSRGFLYCNYQYKTKFCCLTLKDPK